MHGHRNTRKKSFSCRSARGVPISASQFILVFLTFVVNRGRRARHAGARVRLPAAALLLLGGLQGLAAAESIPTFGRRNTAMHNGGTASFIPRPAGEAVVVALAAAAVLLCPRFPQNPAYHSYVDARPLLGVPHGANVLSSLPVAAPGLAGLVHLWRVRPWGMSGAEAASWAVSFAGMASVGLTSSIYHASPSMATLVYDRLSIAVSFTALVAALLAQRRGAVVGAVALPVLVAAGAGSVLYWGASEAAGRGDLRPYALTQGGSVLACLYLLLADPPPPGRSNRRLLAALALYAAAMAAEQQDQRVYRLTAGLLSGHTLKHLVVAASEWQAVRHLREAAAAADGAGPRL